MIHFETSIGKVTLRFGHNMPRVEPIKANNHLAAMVQNIKVHQGYTECRMVIENGGQVVSDTFGVSYVHPWDQYKKETGRELSLKRAIENSFPQFNEATVREIMVGYYSR